MINPEEFMNQSAPPMETKFALVPAGEFPMMFDSDPDQIIPKEVKWTDKNGDPQSFWQLEMRCIVQDEAVKAEVGLDRVTVRLRINLDFDTTGALEFGKNKNLMLGRIREALNQNHAEWKPADLLGAGPFIGKVAHNASKTNPERKFADVVAVAKAA